MCCFNSKDASGGAAPPVGPAHEAAGGARETPAAGTGPFAVPARGGGAALLDLGQAQLRRAAGPRPRPRAPRAGSGHRQEVRGVPPGASLTEFSELEPQAALLYSLLVHLCRVASLRAQILSPDWRRAIKLINRCCSSAFALRVIWHWWQAVLR